MPTRDVGLDDLGHRLGLLRCAERGGKVSLRRLRRAIGFSRANAVVRDSVTNRCRRSRAPRGHREKKRARRPRTRARVATRGMPARHAQRARRARPSRARSRRSRSRLLHERTCVRLRRISHARARARVARRTWTLDALRAATEPVKVEAMQAIVVVWCLVEEGCVCRNGDRDARQ